MEKELILKTLNELNQESIDFRLDKNELIQSLKQEAIKWYKYFDELYKVSIVEDGVSYTPEELHKRFAMLSSMNALKQHIKYFFNLTEEDLK